MVGGLVQIIMCFLVKAYLSFHRYSKRWRKLTLSVHVWPIEENGEKKNRIFKRMSCLGNFRIESTIKTLRNSIHSTLCDSFNFSVADNALRTKCHRLFTHCEMIDSQFAKQLRTKLSNGKKAQVRI